MTHRKSGFTLVELSIVLVIIGLLIGGVLSAQSMIQTARGQRIVKEMTQYEIMYKNFVQNYNSDPGDSQSFIPAGNGDGDVEDGYPVMEHYAFWTHLHQAGYTDKNYSCVTGICVRDWQFTTFMSAWGVPSTYPEGVVPKGPVNNSVFYLSDYRSTGGKLWLGLQSPEPYTPTLTGTDILPLDTKLDDGLPSTGSVTAEQASCSGTEYCFTNSASGGCGPTTSSRYIVGNSTKECFVYFNLNQY